MSREAFETWWESEGQFLRAGGGDYEKTFAFHAWQAAQDDAFERAAKLCEEHYAGPISAVIFEHEHETAQVLAEAIRALAKEAT